MRTHEELFNEVCNPAFVENANAIARLTEKIDRVEKNTDTLVKDVSTGNGKPAIKERMAVAEVKIDELMQHPKLSEGADTRGDVRSKGVKLGPLEINGYTASDVGKIGLGIGVAFMIWMNYHGLRTRNELADKAETIAAKVVQDQSALTRRIDELAAIIGAKVAKRP